MNVLETHQLSSDDGPSELQASFVSYCHFRLFRATHSLREDVSLLAISLSQCQTSTVTANEPSSPSSPPLEAHTPSKMSQREWKHAFPRLDLQTESYSLFFTRKLPHKADRIQLKRLRRRSAKKTKVTLSIVTSDRAPPTSEIKPCLNQRT